MAGEIKATAKMLGRVRRIHGQVAALERAIKAGVPSDKLMQQIASCRGALNGLMALVAETHIQSSLGESPARLKITRPLLDLVHRYFK